MPLHTRTQEGGVLTPMKEVGIKIGCTYTLTRLTKHLKMHHASLKMHQNTPKNAQNAPKTRLN